MTESIQNAAVSILAELNNKTLNTATTFWDVKVLRGWNRYYKEDTNYIQLTSQLYGQKVIFTLKDFSDRQKTDEIVGKLSETGTPARQSFVAALNLFVEALIRGNQIFEGSDLSDMLDLEGQNAMKDARAIAKFYLENQDMFPSKSSDLFNKEYHYGAVLDQYYDGKTVYVAFLPIILREEILAPCGVASKKYREILKSLIRLGVLDANLGSVEFRKKQTLSYNKEEHVYIFKLHPSLLEGVKQYATA